MSVRVYQLAKDLGMESKEIIRLLYERGLKVTSASSSIPNIYASALIEELGSNVNQDATISVVEDSKIAEEKDQKVETVSQRHAIEVENLLQITEQGVTILAEEPLKEVALLGAKITKDPVAAMEDSKVDHRAILANAAQVSDAPTPKKLIKVPLPKSPRRVPIIFREGKEEQLEVASIRTNRVERDDENSMQKSEHSTQKEATVAKAEVLPVALKKSLENVGALKSDGNDSEVLLPRKKVPFVSAYEKRSAPVVRFQFTPKGQQNRTPFNANKVPEALSQSERKGGEPKALVCKAPVIVRDFAQKIGLKPFQLISELMRQGIFASMNQQIADDLAIDIAGRYGFRLEIRHKSTPVQQNIPKVKVIEPKELLPRPPVVCVLGHVDHGKTTLLDAIRHANVVAGEAGGITQHIGAYQVDHGGEKITFLDTPGHAAFSNMRERSANVTDIAILVVAADDGFMPQTDEALQFAKKAGVPVVVAVNKIDAKGANFDRVKQQMQQRDIAPEEWGGDTLCIGISALKGTNIDGLLSLVLLQAEIMELKADYKCSALGIVIESQIDMGRGPTATVIVREGTLKVGDAIVCGKEYCRVRSMLNEKEEAVKVATPAMAVKIMGWSGLPMAGDIFEAVKDERTAKKRAEENEISAKELGKIGSSNKIVNVKMLFEAMASQKQKVLKVIVKCDVHGTMEALVKFLETNTSDKVGLEVISSGVGAVSKNDVEFAHSSEAIIIGFNVKMDTGVAPLAKNKGVRILLRSIIYELVDQVKEAMAELLDYEYKESYFGTAEIRCVFNLTKAVIAGCMVVDGQIIRDRLARVRRGDRILFEGKVDSLKRQKDDYSEVRSGFECGIRIEGFSNFEKGDMIECFEMVQHRQTL